jgi:hypothetical protein
MSKPATVTICASIVFYKEVVRIQEAIEKAGFRALVPKIAEQMKKANDFNVDHYKPTLAETQRKADLMMMHFKKVSQGDAVLVVNNEKHGQANYIGGNVLMEMALAFFQKKPIFLWNDAPKESTFLEEILGVEPIILNRSVAKLAKELKRI